MRPARHGRPAPPVSGTGQGGRSGRHRRDRRLGLAAARRIAGTDVTVELLRVSGALAAFSGLYYAIAVLTDGTYREEFLEELTGSMRDTFRLRARYLALRATTASGP